MSLVASVFIIMYLYFNNSTEIIQTLDFLSGGKEITADYSLRGECRLC